MGSRVQDFKGAAVTVTGDSRRLFLAAMASLIFLLVCTLAYPEYDIRVGLYVGSVRVSVIALLFIAAAPAVSLFVLKHLSWVRFTALDAFLMLTLLYITARGAPAATDANGIGLVFAFAVYILLFYYGTAFLGQGGLRPLFAALVVMGVIAAAYAMIEFALGENVLYGSIIKPAFLPFPGIGYHRSSSLLGAPGPLGLFMVQVAPIILFFFLRSKDVAVKIFLGLALLLVMLALLVTFGKGPWITAIVLSASGIAWILWKHRNMARLVLALALAAALVLGAFVFIFHDTVQAGTVSKARTSESFKPREYMWYRVPSTFMAHPWLGAGIWQGNAEIFKVNPAPEYKDRPASIDNMYLTTPVEEGIIGTVLIVMTFSLMASQGWRTLRSDAAAAWWGWPAAASMVGVMIAGFTENDLLNWPNMVVFWLTAGMLRALSEGLRTSP